MDIGSGTQTGRSGGRSWACAPVAPPIITSNTPVVRIERIHPPRLRATCLAALRGSASPAGRHLCRRKQDARRDLLPPPRRRALAEHALRQPPRRSGKPRGAPTWEEGGSVEGRQLPRSGTPRPMPGRPPPRRGGGPPLPPL